MSQWLVFALFSVCLTVTYELLSKRLLNSEDDHDPIAYASSLFFIVAICSSIAYIFTGVKMSDLSAFADPQKLLILIINLMLYSIAPSLYWRALKYLPASEVAILYDLTSFYIFIFGILLGTETFLLMRLVGGMLIVGSAALLAIKTQWKNKLKFNKYFLMMMAATVLYAFAALTDNRIVSERYFSQLFFQILSFGIPAGLVLIINRKSVSTIRSVYKFKVYKYTMLNGVIFFGSFWSIYHAYAKGGQTSAVNFVISSGTILTVIASAIFLRERNHLWLKVVCALCTIGGIYLLQ